MAAANQAKTITVVEHSDRFDPNIDREAPYKEKIFRAVVLSPRERTRLSAAFPLSLDHSDLIHLRCLFESHHRIEMIAENGQVTVLKICFHCQQLVVGEEKQRIFPLGWDRSLEQFIHGLGMSRLPKESNQMSEPTSGLAPGRGSS